eukprot:CAMPEP_0198419574 /NCGR_PEP_ID=MMETSP1452-20131203/309_1 /TAXON_ID=1181717 /ORGANISM="Synchroma pusillum, Strain CCMP3072" /LENGTH=81 /DNA_ID=CAMNT_0044139707 /DNA_START=78 /DNA_END=323 /DNA_ORIENTATION=-
MVLGLKLRHRIEIGLLILLATLVFLTYSPEDETYFWQRWFVVLVMVAALVLVDFLFLDSNAMIFDPDTENWRRRTEAGKYQ